MFFSHFSLIAFCWEHKELVILSYLRISLVCLLSPGTEKLPGKLAYGLFKSSTGSSRLVSYQIPVLSFFTFYYLKEASKSHIYSC